MTGRALVKWTPQAGSSGRSVRGYGGSTLIHDGAVLPVVFGLLFMGVGAALHLLVVALVVVVVLVSATAAALWWITARTQRPLSGLPAPLEDDDRSARSAGASGSPTGRKIQVTVQVIDERPRLALPPAPPVVEQACATSREAEVAR